MSTDTEIEPAEPEDLFLSPAPLPGESTDIFDGIDRPPRAEDKVRRHGGNGRPYICSLKFLPSAPWVEIGPEKTMTRVTTLAKAIDTVEALSRWSERMVALGMMQQESLVAEVMQHQEDRQQLDRIVIRAKELAAASDKAVIGTAVHALTEKHDLGIPLTKVPSKYRADLQAWINATRFFRNVAIEQLMVNDLLDTAGTPDRVVQYHPCEICGRIYYILDLKTGRVDLYTELSIAQQLGIYANSTFYELETGERTRPFDICPHKAIVVKLPSGTGVAETIWVDIWTGYRIAVHVSMPAMQARKSKGLLRPFTPTPVLEMLIDGAGSRAEIEALWAEHKMIWTDDHTARANAVLASLK